MRKMWKPLVAAVVAGTMVFSGVALAQTGETGDTVAEDRPGYQRLVETLRPLVDDGTITAEQAEAVAGFLVETIRDQRPHGPRDRLRAGIAEAAEFLGLDVAEVADSLRAGETLADIAAATGSSSTALIDHLVGIVSDHLQAEVDEGTITTEQMADRLAEATERITDMVENGIPERPDGFGGRGHRFEEAPIDEAA